MIQCTFRGNTTTEIMIMMITDLMKENRQVFLTKR